jgi:hypothetical protein
MNQLPDDALFCNVCGEEIKQAAQYAAPDGFILEPNSGQYYMITPGQNPDTGEDGEWTTWYNPNGGGFSQTFRALAPIPGLMPAPVAVSEKKKSKASSVLAYIVFPLLALFIGAGAAFVLGDGLSLLPWF